MNTNIHLLNCKNRYESFNALGDLLVGQVQQQLWRELSLWIGTTVITKLTSVMKTIREQVSI